MPLAITNRRAPLVIAWALAITLVACSGGSSDDSTSDNSQPRAPVVTVGNIRVTVTPEAQRLAQRVGVNVRRGVRRTIERVDELLQFSRPTAVSIAVNAARAIPEVGVGGFTDPGTGSITMSLDPKSRIGARSTLRTWLPQGLAHELDHAKRILDGPGYGTTLGQAIISEGLAETFSVQAFPTSPRTPWSQALSPEELVFLTKVAISNSDQADIPDVHRRWFFGTGLAPPFGSAERIPRWAGYAIGTSIVDLYLQAHPDATPATLTVAPAEQLLAVAA